MKLDDWLFIREEKLRGKKYQFEENIYLEGTDDPCYQPSFSPLFCLFPFLSFPLSFSLLLPSPVRSFHFLLYSSFSHLLLFFFFSLYFPFFSFIYHLPFPLVPFCIFSFFSFFQPLFYFLFFFFFSPFAFLFFPLYRTQFGQDIYKLSKNYLYTKNGFLFVDHSFSVHKMDR